MLKTVKGKRFCQKREFKWLWLDENVNTVDCVKCMKFTLEGKDNVWATGTNNFKWYDIAKHESCTMYRENNIKKKNAVMPSTASTAKSRLALTNMW